MDAQVIDFTEERIKRLDCSEEARDVIRSLRELYGDEAASDEIAVMLAFGEDVMVLGHDHDEAS